MKALLLPLTLLACQSPDHAVPEVHGIVVEAACGQCQFEQPGSDCDLAVRFDGGAYFVDGTGIDDHGDAHAQDGFCNAVRLALVEGVVVGERFVASSFTLLPE